MNKVLVLLAFLFVSFNAMAGGKIAGMVTDEKTGEAIIGATISVDGTALGTASDVDGRFAIEIPTGEYTIQIRYVGYTAKSIANVVVKENEVTDINTTIAEDSRKQLKEVVVSASIKKESISALYVMQRNSVAVSSGISADVIKRTPDKNTGEVLKRVSGTSVKDGKYVVIRGLSDRYNLAMVNSALMPSTEADKKAFSFDIIPSNLIDNIIINKTATPDLPGDFAGGIVTVLTNDAPETNFFNVGINLGYNTQTTFKKFTNNPRGSADYLGFHGDKNALPTEFGKNAQYYNELRLSNPEKQYAAAKSLPNDYKEVTSSAMPNSAFQLAFGNSTRFKKGAKLGTVLGLTLRNTQTIVPEFTRGKYEQNRLHTYSTETQYRYASTMAAMANFAYVAGKTKIGFKNLFNSLYDNSYYQRKGYTTSNLQEFKLYSSVPSERRIYNTQLEGEHAFGTKNIKVNWNLNYSNLNSQQQDLRSAFYARPIALNSEDVPVKDDVTPYDIIDRNSRRYFSNQNDNTYGGNASISYPFLMFNQKQSVKAGYLYQYKDREFAARIFQYAPINNLSQTVMHAPVDQVFDNSNIGTATGFRLDEITSRTDAYKANAMLNAGYVMLDNSFTEKIRLTWGARIESYSQTLMATSTSNKKIDTTSTFIDVLPSANLSINTSEKTKLRLSGSRTVNRPEFREIAPFQFIDFENQWQITGNPALTRANITNGDLRFEYYPSAGEAITAGVFYKHFKNPIEAKMDDQSNLDLLIFGYQNASSAYTAGFEFDFRKNMSFLGEAKWLSNLTASGNFSYIYSRVSTGNIIGATQIIGTKTERPLQGQSPYLINAALLYNMPSTGLAIGAMYNRIGHRIYIVGNGTIPTTWENGRDVIDLQISKAVLKKRGEIKLTVADLLNQPTTFYWNTDTKDAYTKGESKVGKGNDQIFQQYKLGTTFTLGFNYRFGK